MNKRIEEIAKYLAENVAWDEDDIPTVDCLETAKRLYSNGYRKPVDVAREIFEEIERTVFVPHFGSYFVKTSAYSKLKKKYESEGAE